MKKRLAFLITVVAVFSLAACGNRSTPKDPPPKNNAKVTSPSNSNPNSSSDSSSWKQFLKEYEAWVDDYIKIVKKYEANPSDKTLLADDTEMAAKMVDWARRADPFEGEIEDPEDALEYASELLRIVGILSQVID